MRTFNRFKITRRAAYVIVQLGFSISEDQTDLGEQIEVFTVPLTSSTNLAIELFQATLESSVDLTAYFVEMSKRVEALNALSTAMNAKKAEIEASAGLGQDQKEGL